MLKYQGRARALDSVMDTKALIGRVWQRRYLLTPGHPAELQRRELELYAVAIHLLRLLDTSRR